MPTEGPITLKITGSDLKGSNYRVEANGVDISAKISGITLRLHADEVNKATIEYLIDGVELEGTFEAIWESG